MPVEALYNLVERARDVSLATTYQFSDDLMSAFDWKRLYSYASHVIAPCIARLPMAHVTNFPFTILAQILRTDLMEATTPWAVRSFATFISRKSPEARTKSLYTGRQG
ncbi:hypothetical protein N7488_008919 [Penicillium malachiteum]|nr:hypothetical protein N7488_008919 [Penicillium malachiteum]